MLSVGDRVISILTISRLKIVIVTNSSPDCTDREIEVA